MVSRLRKTGYLSRTVVLAAAVVFVLGLLPEKHEGRLAVVLPALSPFLSVCSAIALRSLSWIYLLSIPVLLVSLYRTRWFCRYMCPAGLVLEGASLLSRNKKGIGGIPRMGHLVLVFALGGAVLGYPVFLWLDPLSMFNGFLVCFKWPVTLAALVPGIGFIIVVLLNLWRPYIWCYRICPLGFLQEQLAWIGRPAGRKNIAGQSDSRRMFLAGVVGGVTGGILRNVTGKIRVIRPPGAMEENRFTALCARCGNCINACPEKIIYPDLGETGLPGILTPVVRIGPSYCSEWCSECNKVCPTGAIAMMDLDEKRTVSIGRAVVSRNLCLAWEQREHCMVCDEYCPYHAIKVIDKGGVACPEVDPDVCRGCGLCQTVCPAQKCAIFVGGQEQRRLEPVEI